MSRRGPTTPMIQIAPRTTEVQLNETGCAAVAAGVAGEIGAPLALRALAHLSRPPPRAHQEIT